MGSGAAAERWFDGLRRRFDDWARHRAGVDGAGGAPVVVEVPPGLPEALGRVWSNPELLGELGTARWTVSWFGRVLRSAFRGVAPGPEPARGAALLVDQGVTAAAAETTLPELVADLRQVLPGLERGLPWRSDSGSANAAPVIIELAGAIRGRPCTADCDVLMELVRATPEQRLWRLTELAGESLGVEPSLRVAAATAMGEALARLLESRATIAGRQAWLALEWEATLVREHAGVTVPLNWRVELARRTERAAEGALRSARSRSPGTVAAAAAWYAQAELDLQDALRFADPEPAPADGAGGGGGGWSSGWLRTQMHRGRSPHGFRHSGRPPDRAT